MTDPEATRPRRTPLTGVHERLGATLTDFAGWLMPLRYGSELAEHRAVRTAAGLFDLSHMGEITVTGPEAAEALDYALVGHLSALAPGRARYTMICAPDGGVLDDLIVYRIADQGPHAAAILATLTSAELAGIRYYTGHPAEVAGAAALLARTGYTGEDGFEIFDKPGDFVGRAALAERAQAAPRRVLAGLAGQTRRVPRHGYRVLWDGQACGTVTSGAPSPTLGRPIALAYLDPEVALQADHDADGKRLAVEIRGSAEPAVLVPLPFYRRPA